jgi:hypothetical protein
MKHLHTFALGALALFAVNTATNLYKPLQFSNDGNEHYKNWEMASRVMKAEWDDEFFPPDAQTIPTPPEIPAWKLAVHFGNDREALDGLVRGAMGGDL